MCSNRRGGGGPKEPVLLTAANGKDTYAMKRNLKVLGTVVAAMLALSVVASAAQANQFTAAAYPATISGNQTEAHKFVIGGNRTVTCSTAKFAGSAIAATKELTIKPTYEGCAITVLGNTFDATITMNECDYLFTEPAGGKVDLTCPAGKTVVIDVYSGTGVAHTAENQICTYTIAAQNNLGSNTYANNGNNVDVTTAVTGVAVSRTTGTLAACGAASQTATYNGKTSVSGESGGVGTKVDVG